MKPSPSIILTPEKTQSLNIFRQLPSPTTSLAPPKTPISIFIRQYRKLCTPLNLKTQECTTLNQIIAIQASSPKLASRMKLVQCVGDT